jgi:hypothetical protein
VANLLKEKGAMSVKIQGGRYFVPWILRSNVA